MLGCFIYSGVFSTQQNLARLLLETDVPQYQNTDTILTATLVKHTCLSVGNIREC